MKREHAIRALELWATAIEHRAFSEYDTPSDLAWVNYRPHEAANDAFLHFGLTHPVAVGEIKSALALADDQFERYRESESLARWKSFVGAAQFLGGRVRAVIEYVESSEPDHGPEDEAATRGRGRPPGIAEVTLERYKQWYELRQDGKKLKQIIRECYPRLSDRPAESTISKGIDTYADYLKENPPD